MDDLIRVAALAAAGDPIADLEPGGLPGFHLTSLLSARLLTARPRPPHDRGSANPADNPGRNC